MSSTSALELELIRKAYEDPIAHLPDVARYLEHQGEWERARYLRARHMFITQDSAYIANKNNLRGYLVANRDRCPYCGRQRTMVFEGRTLNINSNETGFVCESCGVKSFLVESPPVLEGYGAYDD